MSSWWRSCDFLLQTDTSGESFVMTQGSADPPLSIGQSKCCVWMGESRWKTASVRPQTLQVRSSDFLEADQCLESNICGYLSDVLFSTNFLPLHCIWCRITRLLHPSGKFTTELFPPSLLIKRKQVELCFWGFADHKSVKKGGALGHCESFKNFDKSKRRSRTSIAPLRKHCHQSLWFFASETFIASWWIVCGY